MSRNIVVGLDGSAITSEAITGDADRLREIARLADLLDLPRIQDEALAAAARIAGGQFYVACVGQFKRGKSTLLDALLDDPVLPSGIVPITAVPTIVRYGERRSARVRLTRLGRATTPDAAPGEWESIAPEQLSRYVSEEHNPGNALGVAAVEVFVPSALLAHSMCLVDTPGVGSVFDANSAATRAFVPQIDAAIVVIGADPPITGDELELIADVARHVQHLLIVLNKADRVTEEERRVAAAFARTVVERRVRRPIGTIYEVSALERLSHTGPLRDWTALVTALQSLADTSGKQLVADAGRRAIRRLTERILSAARDERAALLRPAEQNELHIGALEAMMRDADRALLDLGALFTAEQRRLSARLGGERSEFLREALAESRQALAADVERIHGRFGPRLRRAMMRAAQNVAHRFLDPWLLLEQESAGAAYRESMARFAELADGFLNRLASLGTPELESLRGALDSDIDLGTQSTFVFNDVLHVAEPASPFRYVADIGLGLVARRVLEHDAERFLGWLLEMNSSRVQSDVDQRIGERRRRLESQIRILLEEVESRARRVLLRAREARAAGADAIDRELRRLQDLEEQVTRLSGEAH